MNQSNKGGKSGRVARMASVAALLGELVACGLIEASNTGCASGGCSYDMDTFTWGMVSGCMAPDGTRETMLLSQGRGGRTICVDSKDYANGKITLYPFTLSATKNGQSVGLATCSTLEILGDVTVGFDQGLAINDPTGDEAVAVTPFEIVPRKGGEVTCERDNELTPNIGGACDFKAVYIPTPATSPTYQPPETETTGDPLPDPNPAGGTGAGTSSGGDFLVSPWGQGGTGGAGGVSAADAKDLPLCIDINLTEVQAKAPDARNRAYCTVPLKGELINLFNR